MTAVFLHARAVRRTHLPAGVAPGRERGVEVVVGFVLARQRAPHVGSALTIHVPAAHNPARPLAVRVVGIEAAPWEFPPVTFTNLPVYFSPAFLKTRIGAASEQPGASAVEMAV